MSTYLCDNARKHSRPVRVTVPASTANLGPGFDTFGMALGRYDTVDVCPDAGDARSPGVRVEVTGQGAAEVRLDEGHLVVRALRAAAAELGFDPPGLVLRCTNTIPHARGLGSSAAAVVAGIAAAYGLAGIDIQQPENAEVALRLAAALEGHPDNAAASLFGGMVLVWEEDGRHRVARLPVHPRVRPVVLVPESGCSTSLARGMLPETVPHADAVFGAGRAALAVHAMTAAPELLFAATEDRLHQSYRAEAYPASARLIGELRRRGVAAVISGAGPSVLALTTGNGLPREVVVEGFEAWSLDVDGEGVRIETESGGP